MNLLGWVVDGGGVVGGSMGWVGGWRVHGMSGGGMDGGGVGVVGCMWWGGGLGMVGWGLSAGVVKLNFMDKYGKLNIFS